MERSFSNMIFLLQLSLLLIWVNPVTPSTTPGSVVTTTPLPCDAPGGWIEAGKEDSSVGHEPSGGCTRRIPYVVQKIGWRCEDRYCCQKPCSCNNTEGMYKTENHPACSAVAEKLFCYVQYSWMSPWKTICCADHVEDENGICQEPFDCDKHSSQCEGFCIKDGNSSRCDCKFGFHLVNRTKCVDVDECETRNGGCNQTCENTEGSYKCSCKPGWSLVQGSKCYDIDECSVGSAICSHGCINTPGGFNCTCPGAMKLSSDLKTCTGSLTTEVEVTTYPITNSISFSGAPTTEQLSPTTKPRDTGVHAVFDPVHITTLPTSHSTTSRVTSMLTTPPVVDVTSTGTNTSLLTSENTVTDDAKMTIKSGEGTHFITTDNSVTTVRLTMTERETTQMSDISSTDEDSLSVTTDSSLTTGQLAMTERESTQMRDISSTGEESLSVTTDSLTTVQSTNIEIETTKLDDVTSSAGGGTLPITNDDSITMVPMTSSEKETYKSIGSSPLPGETKHTSTQDNSLTTVSFITTDQENTQAYDITTASTPMASTEPEKLTSTPVGLVKDSTVFGGWVDLSSPLFEITGSSTQSSTYMLPDQSSTGPDRSVMKTENISVSKVLTTPLTESSTMIPSTLNMLSSSPTVAITSESGISSPDVESSTDSSTQFMSSSSQVPTIYTAVLTDPKFLGTAVSHIQTTTVSELTTMQTTTVGQDSNNSSFIHGHAVTATGKKVPLLVLILAPLLAALFLLCLCCFLGFRYCRKEAEETYAEDVVAFDNMAYDAATGVTVIEEEDDIKKKKEPEPPDVVYVDPESDKKKLAMMGEYDEVMGKPPPYTENDPMNGAWGLAPPMSKLSELQKGDEEEEHFYEEIPHKGNSHYMNMSEGNLNRSEYVLPDQVSYVNVQRSINPWTGEHVTPVTEAEEQNQINDLVKEI